MRRKKVLEALESQWLKLNHHDYADLEISYENLNDYPEDVPPAVVDYHHRETNKFLESTSVHNMEAEDGTADGMCPLTVHGITGEQYANASPERLKTIAMEHLTDMGKFIVMNSLFSFYSFIFSFSFLLTSVPILPRVLKEPSTLLTLIHDTFFRRLIHPFRFYSASLHSEPFAIGWLSI